MKTVFFINIVLFQILFFLVGCFKSESNQPLISSGAAPEKVNSVQVENLAGAAKISYAIPNNENVLYVLATYTMPNGEVREVKSSVFKNYVLIEGFSQEIDYNVKLYTVNRDESKSEPVAVTVHPLRSPVDLVMDGFQANETFGGVNTKYTNPYNTEFVLTTLVKDSNGVWVEKDRYFSSKEQESYSIRRPEFTPDPKEFAFYFTDKWKNQSDTIYKTLTPLFEQEFDKALWVDAALTDDSNIPMPPYGPLKQLWTPGTNTYFFLKSDIVGLKLPNWFTIDLGKKYRFGRMVVNQLAHNVSFMYGGGSPEMYEVWASNEKTTDWSKWTMLGSFRCVKPSGLPVGQLTAEDQAKAKAGDFYDFDPSPEAYRYVRFKITKTFSNVAAWYLLELTFFGASAQ